MTDNEFIDGFLKKYIYDSKDDRWIREDLLPDIIDTARKSCAEYYKTADPVCYYAHIYEGLLTAPIQGGV